MLKYGNRDFRSLQEQVYANMKNIEDIIKGSDIMANYTLQIVGQVDDADELPDPDTYDGKLGDIYVVGDESPFHGYAFVKVYENENAPDWVDLGAILVQGPQGEQGPQGPQGEQGVQGDQGVPAGFGVPSASIQGGVGTPNVSITASGPNTARVFDFTFYNLKGEKGDKGTPGEGVPEIQSGDAGKALIVNQDNETASWSELPSGLPDIESGDAGKLLAVNSGETGVEWVTDNNLKLPSSAPASQALVGINNSGVQNALILGDGFEIDNNTLNIPSEILKIDMTDFAQKTISEELYSKLTTTQNLILYIYNVGSAHNYDGIYTYNNSASKYELVAPIAKTATTINYPSLECFGFEGLKQVLVTLSGLEGSRQLSITESSYNTKFLTKLSPNEKYIYLFDNTSGTHTGGQVYMPQLYSLAYREGDSSSNYKYVKLNLTYIDNNTKTLYAEGKSAAYKYVLEWNLNTKAYTITQTAL